MHPKSQEKLRKLLQIKINQFCQIFKITREEFKSKLNLKTTSNLVYFEMSNLITKIENTIKSFVLFALKKIDLFKIWQNLKFAINQVKQSFFAKNQFKKLKRTYNQNTQTFIYSKNYQKNL